VEWISLDVDPIPWWRNIVSESTDWGGVACHIELLPFSKEAHEEVSLELAVKNLGEEVKVGDEGGLQDDWDVGGVEKFDWEWLGDTTHLSILQSKFDTETLEIDNDKDDEDGSQQV